MGKKKASVIAIAVLTCIVCLSMIAGATFALFTDNDKVNVSVTTANLSVKAEIADVAKDTNGTTENKQLAYDYNQADKLLTVDNMLPGDVVTFKVTITSGASVDVKYRVKFGCTTKDSSLFEQMLLGVKDSADGEYTYYVSSTSAWGQIDYNATDASKMVVTKYVAIELPAYVSAKALEAQTCNIEFAVEAVQANATGDYFTANETSVKAVRVKDTALTDNVIDDSVIANLQDEGDCLVLDGTSVHNWTIDTTLAKMFSVRGCDVDTLTVNAPNATINYRVNNTRIIEIAKTASKSFHVYGVVTGSLTVKEGRAVVEQGAQVASAVIAPAAEAEATIVTNASVANLSVEGAGKANVEVAKDVVIESVEVTNTGKTDITNNGSFGNITADENADITSTGSSSGVITVTDEKSLAAAIKIGGEVVLVNDIVLEHTIRISNSVTLKLSGHAITFTPTEDLVTRPLVINEGAALTVYGEESGSQILVTVDTVYGVFDIYGELAVYGGHYEASDGTGGSVVRGRVGSKTHIYSGEFVSKGYGAALYDEGDCIIEDGYFFTNSNNRKNNAWSYCFQNAGGTMHVKNATVIGIQGGIAAVGGETIIDDCTVNVRDPFKTSEKDNKSFYALYVNGNHAEATCRVNGGEFTSEYRYAVFIGNPTPGDGGEQRYSMAEIYGGTFISGTEGPECVLVSDPNGNGYIPGGTYISHVKTAAQLKQALAANLPNYTIVLDDNIKTGYVDIKNDLTLNLNEHTLDCYRVTVGVEEKVVNAAINNGTLVCGYTNVYAQHNAQVTLNGLTASAWGTQAVYVASTGGIVTIESGKYLFSYLENQNGYLYGTDYDADAQTGVNYSVYPATADSNGRIVDLSGNQINAENTKVELLYSKEYGGIVVTVDGEVFKDSNNNVAYMNRFLLNCKDAAYQEGTSNIIVKGGEFVNFNPALNVAEGNPTIYVAEGYSVVYNKGADGNYIFKVMADGEVESFLAANEGWTLDA